MNIKQNSVVALTYNLFTDENGEEKFVEKTTDESPLVFLYGTGMMLPKFEENLTDLKAGDTYDFHLNAADAYGEFDDAATADLALEMFKDVEKPEVGAILPLQDNNGHHFDAKVTNLSESHVTVDLNHPMAGKDLHFKGKIISVRDATKEELAHGHAHGADGTSGH